MPSVKRIDQSLVLSWLREVVFRSADLHRSPDSRRECELVHRLPLKVAATQGAGMPSILTGVGDQIVGL